MTREVFTRWDPWWWYRDVPTNIDAIYEDSEGFRILISADRCPPTRVSVPLGALVLYRVYDEIGLTGLDHSGVRPGHCFYVSESSPFLSESAKMNVAAYGRSPRHYAIYTGGRCIDMISTAEPRFVILREFASGRYASERPERMADDDMNGEDSEFSKVGANHAKSAKGFSVSFYPQGGLDYTDVDGTVRVDTELYVKPLRVMIYRESGGLRGKNEAQVHEVLMNIQRALEFLGHRNEISEHG